MRDNISAYMLFGKYINKYYLRYLPFIILGIAALIFVDFIETQLPEYLGDIIDIIDEGLKNNVPVTFNDISYYLYAILICSGIMMVCRILWRVGIMHFSHKAQEGLRHDMFVKAERLSVEYYQTNKVGTIMAWFTTDIETIGDFLSWGTVQLVDCTFLSVLVIIRMILVNVHLTIIALIPIALIVVWGALVEKFVSMKWEERQKAYDRLYDFTEENFTGIRVIKAFVKENQELHAFAKIARKNQNVNFSFGRMSILFDVIIEIIISLIFATLFGFGGWIIYALANGQPVTFFGVESHLTIGELTEFIGLFDILIWPMIAMGLIITSFGRARTSLKRITNYLDSPEDIKNPKNPVVLGDISGKITFKDLSFKYKVDGEEILKNVSFEINPGENIGVVGKIGCGKSTLANLLLRLYNVKKGSIFIDDNDIMKCDIDSVRKNIAYSPQDNFLYSDTISNNISFSSDEPDIDKVKASAKFADVHKDITKFKEKYETVLGERGVTISGGQKQRLSLARAFYKDAPVLILDDTVSAVDVKTEEMILSNIQAERQGKTTIVIASRVSTVINMDRILVMVDGQVEAFDTHKNLMKTSEAYKKMVYLQKLEKEVEEAQ